MSIYKTDKKYKFGAAFILAFGALCIWASPEYWYYVVLFWALVTLLAYLNRNTQ